MSIFLDLNRAKAFSRLVSNKPVATLYGLRGKYTFKGEDICFYYVFLK